MNPSTRYRRLAGWMRSLLRRSRQERDMAMEMRLHLQAYADDLAAAGATRAEAERRARLEFGSLDAAQERCREARGVGWVEAGWQDARFGARMLRKNPGYAAVAALTLALGIGACTCIFTLIQSVLLRRVPFRDAARIVVVWDNSVGRGLSRIGPSGLDYLDWRAQSRSFEDLFLFEHGTGTITGGGEPEQVAGLRVTPNFNDFLGVYPILGRGFGPAEARSEHHVVLLAYRYWRQRYGGDRNVVGRTMELNSEAYTIVGVLPPTINTVFNIQVVVPFDDAWVRRADGNLGVLGRLKPGVSVRQATDEMNVVMHRIGQARPERRGYGAVLVPLDDVRVESIRPALWILMGAVAFLLLLACANVANLMLGRAATRSREFAMRRALGATPARLVRQCLVESGLLALLAGAGGWLLAEGAVGLLITRLPASIPVPNGADRVPMPAIHIGGVALAFTGAIALITVLVGLAPALASRKLALNKTLKSGGHEGFAGAGAGRARGRIVILECALAFVLLIGAGQMIVGFHRIMSAGVGFPTGHLVTVRVKLANDAPNSPYKQSARQAEAFAGFLRKVREVPGVRSAGLTEIIPLSQDDMDRFTFVVQEAPPPLAPGVTNPADFRGISPGFLRTLGVPLVSGRDFTEADDAQHTNVVLIDEALARHYFAGQDPIGRHIQIGGPSGAPRQIVGVVGSIRDMGFGQNPVPTVYFPFRQIPLQSMGLVVRTRLPASAMVPALRDAIHSVDPGQPVFSARTMDDIVEGTIEAQRLSLLLLDAFALLALVLTIAGIYSVTAYAVSQRTQEIGVRMALGARGASVLRLVLGEGMGLAVRGAAIGVVAAIIVLRLSAHLVFGLAAPGPLLLAAGVGLLAVVAAVSSYVPARRAMRLDPLAALRRN